MMDVNQNSFESMETGISTVVEAVREGDIHFLREYLKSGIEQ